MPEVQAGRLIEMMRRNPAAPRLEVCLPPFSIRQSALEDLSAGEILSLPIQRLELFLLDERARIVAEALYGTLDDTPSLLIETKRKNPSHHIDSKKYKKLKIVLGKALLAPLEKGRIIPIDRTGEYDAVLQRGEEPFAYARLIQHGRHIALRIEKVL